MSPRRARQGRRQGRGVSSVSHADGRAAEGRAIRGMFEGAVADVEIAVARAVRGDGHRGEQTEPFSAVSVPA